MLNVSTFKETVCGCYGIRREKANNHCDRQDTRELAGYVRYVRPPTAWGS